MKINLIGMQNSSNQCLVQEGNQIKGSVKGRKRLPE